MSEDHTEFAAPDERERPRRALPWWRYRRERPGRPNRGPLLALERRFTREWADVYARQERDREELAEECRGEELGARSDTMRVVHRAERAHSRPRTPRRRRSVGRLRMRPPPPGPLVGPVPSPGRSAARWLFSSWCCWLADLEEALRLAGELALEALRVPERGDLRSGWGPGHPQTGRFRPEETFRGR